MPSLDVRWRGLVDNAHAASTKKTYASAQSQFLIFCYSNNLLNPTGFPCPASELTLLRFLAHLSNRQASTIRVYLAAVRALHVTLGFQDPFTNCLRVPLAVRGLQRSQPPLADRNKLPITALTLQTLKLHLDCASFNDAMIWAACCTAFYGFLRAAEFTVPPSGFDPDRHLTVSSVAVDQRPFPATAFISLKYSKTDQFGKGCTVVLACSDSPLCPVSALMAYLHMRGPGPGPLFRFADLTPLTRANLFSRLRGLLQAAGWEGNYTTHSFRVGAATTAASLGFPDHLIKALGRWSSDAYRLYIKIPQAQLSLASQALATSTRWPSPPLNRGSVIW